MSDSNKVINAGRIVRNVSRVFLKEDINLLSKESYNHIITRMGFIAHYDLVGFQHEYRILIRFAEKLLTSEIGDGLNNTFYCAENCKTVMFTDHFGIDVANSFVDAIIGIRKVAIDYLEKHSKDEWILDNIETLRSFEALDED